MKPRFYKELKDASKSNVFYACINIDDKNVKLICVLNSIDGCYISVSRIFTQVEKMMFTHKTYTCATNEEFEHAYFLATQCIKEAHKECSSVPENFV
jgi:hypothetical protein